MTQNVTFCGWVGGVGQFALFFLFFNPLPSQNGTELFVVWQMTAVEKGSILA